MSRADSKAPKNARAPKKYRCKSQNAAGYSAVALASVLAGASLKTSVATSEGSGKQHRMTHRSEVDGKQQNKITTGF